jgi:MerR family mercuric resistance operon transcriptional regulator
MVNTLTELTIGALARLAGVNVETIRFYQRRGLLAKPRRRYGTIRRYGQEDLARLRFIKAAKHLGFSLDGVTALLKLEDGTHCAQARVLAEEKLEDVRNKLADLRNIESVLAEMVRNCAVSEGKIRCPLISSLQQP